MNKEKIVKIVIIIQAATILFLLLALLVMNSNFNYNVKVTQLKDKALDICIEFADNVERTLYNYEFYCPDVVTGIENGSLEYIDLYKELEDNGELSKKTYYYDGGFKEITLIK